MSDIGTIIWKEWRDAFFPGGKLISIPPLLFIVLLGVIWPLIDHQGWLTLSSAMVLLNIIFPYFYLLNYIGDSFAGERERHTLETLLASRISDRAILWGKVIANVSFIWGMTIIASLVSFVVVNLVDGQGLWMFYTPVVEWLGVLLLSLLSCFLAASWGILVSMHSPTIRQAQQISQLASLGFFVLVYLALRGLPPQVFAAMSSTQIFLILVLVLAVLDAILMAISMASFHRSRLILS